MKATWIHWRELKCGAERIANCQPDDGAERAIDNIRVKD